ncbi:MAG: hypothetical protein HGN29_02095 [Asgard group archaeon]|nr:hypothetical protein [Asgard group archaeon]
MKNKNHQLFGTFLIILCLNTLVINRLLDIDYKEKNDTRKLDKSLEMNDNTKNSDARSDTPYNDPVTKSETLGDFETFAFFPGGTGYIYGESRVGETLITDPSGEDPYGRRNIVEWVPYDEIKNDGTLNKEFYWRALSSVPKTWPNDTNWFYLREQGYPNEPSKIYSPVFTEDYEISGKVHWWSWLTVNDSAVFSEAVTIGYRVLLYLFNPADPLNPQLIASRTQTYPISMWTGYRTFSDTISTTTIPAGYRLRWDIQLSFSSVPSTGSFLHMTGYPYDGTTSSTTWTINDDIYSNTYTINNVTRMTGIQLYMRSKRIPDINLLGASNETVYQTAQEMTIDVTDGSTSSYRWDGGSWIPFENQTTINLPSVHGWHDLETEAIDPVFGNTRTEFYRFGYDASTTNLVLNSPINGSTIGGGSILNFTAFSVDTVEYMWDNNGMWYLLSSPYDITNPSFSGLHNITLRIIDFYSTETFFYQFTFDSDFPTVILYNVIDGSTYAPGKIIEVEIDDDLGINNVNFHWDSDGDAPWLPAQGKIYQTSLPSAEGNHYLYISAYDNYEHLTNVMFQFYTDPNVFLVELAELRNNSYYLGGEEVIINVQKSNGTISYIWDGGIREDGDIIAGQLTLTGVDALPSTPGFHNLTVFCSDVFDVEHIFFFNLTVDQTAPNIDNSILIYNNTRFTTDTIFIFTITDNYILSSDLIVLYSIDEKANQTLIYPYQFNLITLADGKHEFCIYALDIAGNFEVKLLVFIIDTTKPTIDVTIPLEVDYTSIDGNIYIPSDATIQIDITDDDNSVFSYYAWNGSSLIQFTDEFILSQPDGTALLYIFVNDSLGNFQAFSRILTIDSDAPIISLSSFPENTTVNGGTIFGFSVYDEYLLTVSEIRYYWDSDLTKNWWNDNVPLTDFEISFLPNPQNFYDHNETASVVIEATDVLGSSATYIFDFLTDFEAPIIKLYLNESGVLTELINGGSYIFTGNTPIWYNSSVNQDLARFYYKWDDDETDELREADSWIFKVKPVDGNHTLQINLFDDAIGLAPNKASATFYIKVADIDIKYIDPTEKEWINDIYSVQTNYSDIVYFIVNVTDTVNQIEITDLYTRHHQESYNFKVDITKQDSTIYYCEIECTNITNGNVTFVDIEFYTLAGGSRTIRVNLIVDKKIADLSILDESRFSVYYGEDVTVYLNLKDHLGQNISIDYVEVNSVSTMFYNISGTSTYWFNYSTYALPKGNYSFDIYVESKFYYAIAEGNLTFEFEVLPLPLYLDIQVSNFTVLEGTQLAITGILTYENDTGVPIQEIHFYIYSYSYDQTSGVQGLIPTNYTTYVILNKTTDFSGSATVVFTMSPEIDYVMINATFDGDNIRSSSSFELEEKVIRIVPPGFPSWMLYLIIGGSVLAVALIAFIVYKVTRPKEFEELLSNLTDEDIALNYSIVSPGVILTIFDQRKGPTPLLEEHSLNIARYKNRMQIDVENFLLKIADQAYSSLGFEEHDAGRRTGSIVLPREKMIGFIHGIQLSNEAARGGFENLSLIVLADSDFGNFLLNYQDFLYDEVDDLIKDLKAKKELPEIKEKLEVVRKKSVMIMLAAQELEETQPE